MKKKPLSAKEAMEVIGVEGSNFYEPTAIDEWLAHHDSLAQGDAR